jgi:hypothetical protein
LSMAWGLFERGNYLEFLISRNLIFTWAHLNGVLHKSLPSVCVPICISLSLLGNDTVKTFPLHRIHGTIEEFLDICFCGSVYPSVRNWYKILLE